MRLNVGGGNEPKVEFSKEKGCYITVTPDARRFGLVADDFRSTTFARYLRVGFSFVEFADKIA